MATTAGPIELTFPRLPAKHDQFLQYVAANPNEPMLELLDPYKQYDAELRKAFAQQPDHPAAKTPNVLPVFAGHEKHVTIRARDLEAETRRQRDCYIMPLKDRDRKPDGAPAIMQSFEDFQTNFNVFSESSLADLDWSNVVVAGSAVVTSLLSVPEKHSRSKRALRRFYHEIVAPASDVDLFLYGLTEGQAIEKIKQIEQNVRDALLVETTTVRTKNAVTIAGKHPVRHVQIVLRIYKSISEILTGFDVDCSCVAYDGKQVYVSPRALVSIMTQINTIDLTRRSPSYENRLSKYAHRGFEVYWPSLDRSRIDPTIFERSFGRIEGLARLLVLEKLPTSQDRESYLDQRRAERGRPSPYRNRFRNKMLYGNIKDEHEDEVAEWVDEDFSDYHTIIIPYGEKFHAWKIEKLLFTKDMLLNAEWNKPKDREVNLHRHPAFFGSVEDVMQDCCGHCPVPSTMEEEEVAEEESKKFISGSLTFVKDDPGRQAIGSFNPLNAEGWTEMAYVGNTARLCQAIVDEDVEYVQSWLEQEGNNPSTRDYTGRTPLHLAVSNSSVEVVQTLIDHSARIVARLVDGRTALHLAAARGSVEMVSALLRKSAANEDQDEGKIDARRASRKAAKESKNVDVVMDDNGEKNVADSASPAEEDGPDIEMVEGGDADTNMNDATTEGSMVNIRKPKPGSEDTLLDGEDENEPDVFDINVVAWDVAASPLHVAIANGHVDVVKCLVQEYGADVLLPIKRFNDYDKSARAAILTLVLSMQLPLEQTQEMVKTLISLGASAAQAEVAHKTVLQYCVADRPDILDILCQLDPTGVKRAINHLADPHPFTWCNKYVPSPLITAIQAKDGPTATRLLVAGAKPEVDFAAYIKALGIVQKISHFDPKSYREQLQDVVEQPVIGAVNFDLPGLARAMIVDFGADINTLSPMGWSVLHNEWRRSDYSGTSVLDVVRNRIEELKEWKFDPRIPEPPKPMDEDADYLSEFEEGTFAHFAAKRQVENARERHKRHIERYEEELERKPDRTGVDEKQQAIDDLISELEQLETTLVERGAKTFYELHPHIKKPDPPRSRRSYERPAEEAFAVNLEFRLGYLSEEERKRYLCLFEAAWSGDLATLKDLTTTVWQDEKGVDHPPLTMAVRDEELRLTPIAIAVLQGHRDVADAAMQIARTQYVAPEEAKRRRYGINGGDEGGDFDEDSDDEVEVFSEVVDDDFTKEDVGKASLEVMCESKPAEVLGWAYHQCVQWVKEPASTPAQGNSSGFSYFGPRKPHTLADRRSNLGGTQPSSDTLSDNLQAKDIDPPETLIGLAIRNNDLELLGYLLKLGFEYEQSDATVPDDRKTSFFELSVTDSNYAVQVGRAHVFGTLAEHHGTGLELDYLVEKYGVELKEKPKYYQGLTVRGSKRKDWASKHGGAAESACEPTPHLLQSILDSSLEIVEWWLSDAPMRCYREFAEANKADKRIYRLMQSDDGFEDTIRKYLARRSHLAIHCAVLAPLTVESMKVLQYLLQAMPEKLEAKSIDGLTPLHVAFATYNRRAAKMLIDAKADQMCRDSAGRNLVHALLDRNPDDNEQIAGLKAMLELIDKRLVREMFLQRSASRTPLASWSLGKSPINKDQAATLDVILSYSGGQELTSINGEGDTPLHDAVKHDDVLLVEALLARDPELLNRENATGRTPFEMAHDAVLAHRCNEPPPMPNHHQYTDRRAVRYGLPWSWHEDILDREAKEFAAGGSAVAVSDRERVWRVSRDTRAKLVEAGKAKRRLVTLQEANEVARRLAGRKSLVARDDAASEVSRQSEGAVVGDEVRQLVGGRWFYGVG